MLFFNLHIVFAYGNYWCAGYFVADGSSVHATFLNASNAFDRVGLQHMKLFEKLIQRKVPMCFVRLLKQMMQIKLGKHLSELLCI